MLYQNCLPVLHKDGDHVWVRLKMQVIFSNSISLLRASPTNQRDRVGHIWTVLFISQLFGDLSFTFLKAWKSKQLKPHDLSSTRCQLCYSHPLAFFLCWLNTECVFLCFAKESVNTEFHQTQISCFRMWISLYDNKWKKRCIYKIQNH